MSKYLESEAIANLTVAGDSIRGVRNKLFAEYGIDLLDTDALTKLELIKITDYDTNLKFNFARNGEDAASNDTEVEVKCSKIKKQKRGKYPSASFQFHAMGDINHPRYIFAVFDKETLSPVRLYDISTTENVSLVQAHLNGESSKWLQNGRLDESKMKRDVIMIGERDIVGIHWHDTFVVDGCTVHVDNPTVITRK